MVGAGRNGTEEMEEPGPGDWSRTWIGEECAGERLRRRWRAGEAQGRRDGSREKAGEQKRLGLAGGTVREGGTAA